MKKLLLTSLMATAIFGNALYLQATEKTEPVVAKYNSDEIEQLETQEKISTLAIVASGLFTGNILAPINEKLVDNRYTTFFSVSCYVTSIFRVLLHGYNLSLNKKLIIEAKQKDSFIKSIPSFVGLSGIMYYYCSGLRHYDTEFHGVIHYDKCGAVSSEFSFIHIIKATVDAYLTYKKSTSSLI